MTSNKQDSYLLVAAIDFGTTYSGYAFSTRYDFKRDPTNTFLKQWVDPTSSMMYNKTSTCILFTKEKEFSQFGFDAEAKYLDLIFDKEQKDWYFFRRFKMSLYDLQSGDKEISIEDETGKPMNALIVFSESLKYLKQSLLQEARKQQTSLEIEDIKWILTVPAIWSDPAKAFMRAAAVEAGIDSEMLTIALEPEAAALYVKHLPVERRVGGQEGDEFQTFSSGSKYIVVDAGGGTIDITAHQVMEDGNVKELIKATGGDWGGTRVDGEYIDFIKCLIGRTATDEITQNAPNVLFEACREFESAKRSIKPKSDIKFNVRIPIQIGETYMKTHPGRDLKSVEAVTAMSKKQIKISFTGDKLRLASSDAESFFTQSVQNIIKHIRKLFQQKDGRGISTIILVGGYAESPILIEGIKSSFPNMRTIIPQDAAWSVLRGAVIFGHDPSLIRQRRSKYSYGVSVYRKFDPAKHDEERKYEKDGEFRCGDLFSKIVEADQLVTVGEYQKEKHYTMESHGKKGNFRLFSSTSKNPTYVDEKGCFFIGYILLPGHDFLVKEDVVVKMCFGATEIEFSAHQPKSQKTAKYHLGKI